MCPLSRHMKSVATLFIDQNHKTVMPYTRRQKKPVDSYMKNSAFIQQNLLLRMHLKRTIAFYVVNAGLLMTQHNFTLTCICMCYSQIAVD